MTTAATNEPMIEDYLDCTGEKRVFRLSLVSGGNFLEAVELRDGNASGLRFILPVRAGEIPLWGEMRDKIRRRLSQRHMVADDKGILHVLHDTIRAQISDRDHLTTGVPLLLVDDLEVTWEELGKLLLEYTGFGLRIEICDTGDE